MSANRIPPDWTPPPVLTARERALVAAMTQAIYDDIAPRLLAQCVGVVQEAIDNLALAIRATAPSTEGRKK